MSQRHWDKYAGVAELADALDLGSSAVRRVGSSPTTRTIYSYSIIGKGTAPQEHDGYGFESHWEYFEIFLVGYGYLLKKKM